MEPTIEDVLREKREKAAAAAELARQAEEERKQQEKLQQEQEEAERGKALHEQIGGLREGKSKLEADLVQINTATGEVGTVLKEAKRQRSAQRSTFQKSKPDFEKGLITNRKGGVVKNRQQMIQAPDLAEVPETKKYAETTSELKEKIKVARISKERKGPTESEIAELEGKITELEEQTPERVKEKREIEECSAQIEAYGEAYLGTDIDNLANINTFGFDRNDRANTEYLSRFGEKVFKQALFQERQKQLSVMIANKKQEYKKRGYGDSVDEASMLKRAEVTLRARIDRDVADALLEDDRRSGGGEYAYRRGKDMESRAYHAERALPSVTRLELKYDQRKNELVKTTSFMQGSGRFKDSPFGVESQVRGSSEKTKNLIEQLAGADRDLLERRKELNSKTSRAPMFFGKAEYERTELEPLRENFERLQRDRKRLAESLEEQQKRDQHAAPEILEDIGRLIQDTGLFNEKSLQYKEMTIGEVLAEAKRLLEEYKNAKLSPEDEAKANRYADLKGKLDDAQQNLEMAKRG